MKPFEEYLQSQGKRMRTIHSYCKSVQLFLQWLIREELEYQKVSYTDLLKYIQYSKAEGNKQSTLTSKLNAIKHFYNYLQEKGKVAENPAVELKLKKGIQRQPHDLLSWEELEELYQHFPNQNLSGKRNKVIIGLLIYQGITTAELTALELQDIDLENGNIQIPGISRSNERTLQLEAHQILPIQFYLDHIRPNLLRNKEKDSPKLFISAGKSHQFTGSLASVLKRAKQVQPKLKSYKQLRASVITHWLKTENLRTVQYKAGHRYVSSTERYRTDKLESLQEQVNELHPLSGNQ